MRDFLHHITGTVPLSLVIIPWSRSWRIAAPEFLDDDVVEETAPAIIGASPLPAPPVFASFGEYAKSVLAFSSIPPVRHIFWQEKTPIVATVTPADSVKRALAFCFVDPAPFLPPGTQRMMVDGRPLMRRVVVGHVPQRNNDLAIAVLNPLQQGPVDFWAYPHAA